MKSFLKQKLIGGIVFGFGIIISILGVSIIYSSWSGYSDLPTTNVGSGLTNTMWNNMVAMINKSIKQDSEIISVDNTNQRIGIGTNVPSAKLEVNGGIKFGGKKINRITICSYVGVPSQCATGHFYKFWTTGECDNGLPSGNCMGFLSKAEHGGSDQDWKVLNPGENLSCGGAATNGGIDYWVVSASGNGNMSAIYMCDQ